jgi:hypothetical protein
MNQNQQFLKRIQPQWSEQKRAEEEYFIKQEKQRSMWFDFFCINPLNKQINYARNNNTSAD